MTDNLDVSNTNGLPFMYEQRHPALIIFIAIKNYTAYLRVHQVHNFKKQKKTTHTQRETYKTKRFPSKYFNVFLNEQFISYNVLHVNTWTLMNTESFTPNYVFLLVSFYSHFFLIRAFCNILMILINKLFEYFCTIMKRTSKTICFYCPFHIYSSYIHDVLYSNKCIS